MHLGRTGMTSMPSRGSQAHCRRQRNEGGRDRRMPSARRRLRDSLPRPPTGSHRACRLASSFVRDWIPPDTRRSDIASHHAGRARRLPKNWACARALCSLCLRASPWDVFDVYRRRLAPSASLRIRAAPACPLDEGDRAPGRDPLRRWRPPRPREGRRQSCVRGSAQAGTCVETNGHWGGTYEFLR